MHIIPRQSMLNILINDIKKGHLDFNANADEIAGIGIRLFPVLVKRSKQMLYHSTSLHYLFTIY